MANPIIIEFIADTTGLEQAMDSLEQLGAVDKQAADQFKKANIEFANRKKALEESGKLTDSLSDKVKKVPKKIIDDAGIESLDKANKNTRLWTDSLKHATRQNKEVQIALEGLTVAQKAWNAYMGNSIGLVRSMKLALAGLGIGLVVVAIWAGVKAWQAYQDKQAEVYADSIRMANINTKVAESTNAMAVELDGYVKKLKDENTTVKEKEGILQIVNEKYGDQIGHFKDLNDLEKNFIERAPAYIQVLLLRAQAQAALNLAMEQQQQIMRNELPAAIQENVKWYDFLGAGIRSLGGNMAEWASVTTNAAERVNESTGEATDNMNFYLEKFTEFSLQAQDLVNKYGFEAGKTAEVTAKVVRDIWKAMDPVEMIDTPDRIGPEVVEPTIKAMADMNERLLQMQMDAAAEAAKNREDELLEIQQHYQRAADIAGQSFNAIIGFSMQLKENELMDLRERLEAGEISQEQFKEQSAKIKTELAKQQKAAALFQAILAIPQAFLQGMIQGGPVVGAIYAAIATVEAATIAAAKIPKFAAGTRSVEGGTRGQDSVLAMLMPGERVVPTAQNQEYSPILDAIHDRKLPAWYLNAIANGHVAGGMVVEGSGSTGMYPVMDYEQMYKAFQRAISGIPIHQIQMDERGFHRSIKAGTSRMEVMDKRYSSP